MPKPAVGMPHYIPRILSKSQFSRRLNRLQTLVMALFRLLAEQFNTLNQEQIYAIDSFPVAVCDNYRIRCCRLYTNMVSKLIELILEMEAFLTPPKLLQIE